MEPAPDASTERSVRSVLRTLREPRWIGLTLLVAVLCVAFAELGLWQLRRHDARAAANEVLVANLTRPPVPATDLLAGDDPLQSSATWRAVTITGTYDPTYEVVVRNRTHGGELGFEVATPLVQRSGSAVLVLRGWVPNGATAQALPEVPPPPTGAVTVTGRLRPSVPGGLGDEGLPAAQVRRLDVAALAGGVPYQLASAGYVQLDDGQPGSGDARTGPVALDVPEPSAGPHLGYAVQWFLFDVVAVVGWAVLLGAAVRESAAPATRTASPGRTRTVVSR